MRVIDVGRKVNIAEKSPLDNLLRSRSPFAYFIAEGNGYLDTVKFGHPDHNPLRGWRLFSPRARTWKEAEGIADNALEKIDWPKHEHRAVDRRVIDDLYAIAGEWSISERDLKDASFKARNAISKRIYEASPVYFGAQEAAELLGLVLYIKQESGRRGMLLGSMKPEDSSLDGYLDYALKLWEPIAKGYGVAGERGGSVYVFFSETPIGRELLRNA